MKLSTSLLSWPSLLGALFLLSFMINAFAVPQSPQEDEVRFSRLLNSKAGLLKFTSIANPVPVSVPTPSPGSKRTTADAPNRDHVQPAQAPVSSFSMSVSSSSSSSSQEDSAIFKPAAPASVPSTSGEVPTAQAPSTISDAANLIIQHYRAPLFEFSARPTSAISATSGESSNISRSDSSVEATFVQGQNSEEPAATTAAADSQEGILTRPVSRRGPVSVLHTITMGNKLNLTPLFSEPPAVIVEDQHKQQTDVSSTSSPVSSSTATEDSSSSTTETVTTSPAEEEYEYEDYYQTGEPSSSSPSTTTTTSTTPVPVVSNRSRSRSRATAALFQEDSVIPSVVPTRSRSTTTTTTSTTELPTTSFTTTESTTTTAALNPLSTTTPPDFVLENLIVDNLQNHRVRDNELNFPDFEDSPAQLATAESSQPARVNVRPASSGKEYEYEYIYYYYDDEDENAAASSTTTARPRAPPPPPPPARVDSIGIKGADSFSDEKVPAKLSQPADVSPNHLERPRSSKVLQEERPVVDDTYYQSVESEEPVRRQQQQSAVRPVVVPQQPAQKYSPDDYYQPQIVQDEYPETVRTNARQQQPEEVPVPQARPAPTQARPSPTRPAPTHARPAPTTPEPVPVTEAPARAQQSLRHRLRRPQIEPQREVAPAPETPAPVPETPVSDPVPDRRPIYKELTSRRVPPRRPPTPPTEPPTESPVATTSVVQQPSPQQERLPSRTRFPPRVAPTATSQEDVTEEDEVDTVTQYRPVDRPVITARPQPQTEAPSQQQARQYQEAPRLRPQLQPQQRQPEPVQSEEDEEEPQRPRVHESVRQQLEPLPTTTTTVAVQPPTVPAQPAEAVVPADSEEQEGKAKDNFARQKSINDLYALTRLHQLAINTRVPNRKEIVQDTEPVETPAPANIPQPGPKSVPPRIAAGFLSSSEARDEYQEPRTYLPTSAPAPVIIRSTTTTTEASSTTAEEPVAAPGPFRPGRAKFGGRTRPTTTTTATPVSSEQPSLRQASPNRFAGRRRFQPQGQGSTPSETPNERPESPSEPTSASPQPPTLRVPGRNRFAGRRTSTTSAPPEESERVVPSQESAAEERPKPPRRQRPPGFRRRPGAQNNAATSGPEAASEQPEGSPPQPTSQVAPEGPKRRPFARNRPGQGQGPAGPIVGRPLKSRLSTPAPEAPAEVQEEVVSTVGEVPPSENPEAEQQGPVVAQKITVSSSSTVSESAPEVPKRGSAGVLGRLRNRPRPSGQAGAPPQAPAPLPTAAQDEVAAAPAPPAERKPSRLKGILNRRKNAGPGAAAPEASPTNIVSHSVPPEEEPEGEKHQQQETSSLPPGVVVQVSTVVTESEEVSENANVGGEVTEEHSSTTPGSILNRLKSQRKPGSLFRKPKDTPAR